MHQPHLKVINGDLVLCGVAVGQRLDHGCMVTSGAQQLTEFLQHRGTVGRNSCVTGQINLGNASKCWEQLLRLWVLCE